MKPPKQMQAELLAPFTKRVGDKEYPDVLWRGDFKSATQTSIMCIPYIKREHVIDRLNSVFGTDGWQFDLPTSKQGRAQHGRLSCRFFNEDGTEYWITKEDVGTESSQEADKGAISDSLKRCADMFGVGLYLRDMQPMMVGYRAKRYYTDTTHQTELPTAQALSAYLNGYSSNQGLLIQIIKNRPELWERADIQELYNIL